MWLMLQQEKPEDFVIATGEVHSVRELVELAFKEIGVNIVWVSLLYCYMSHTRGSLFYVYISRQESVTRLCIIMSKTVKG